MPIEPDSSADDPIGAIQRFITAGRNLQARQLIALREKAGLTQDQLARRMEFSRSTVANAEAGEKRASADFWRSADKALRTNGVLLARYNEIQDATRRQAELLDRQADAHLEAALHESSSAGPASDSLTGAGLRVSAAILDLLTVIRDAAEPERDMTGVALHFTGPTLLALRRVQDETGHSPARIANSGIQLYSFIRTLLADGAEIVIRTPGTDNHTMLLT